MASVQFDRKSATGNRKSFLIQPGATPAAKKPLLPWGLRLTRGCKTESPPATLPRWRHPEKTWVPVGKYRRERLLASQVRNCNGPVPLFQERTRKNRGLCNAANVFCISDRATFALERDAIGQWRPAPIQTATS